MRSACKGALRTSPAGRCDHRQGLVATAMTCQRRMTLRWWCGTAQQTDNRLSTSRRNRARLKVKESEKERGISRYPNVLNDTEDRPLGLNEASKNL